MEKLKKTMETLKKNMEKIRTPWKN